jgi:putative ABC transport system permease protein
MIVSDTFSLALRNLGQAKLRTTLTVLGVAIGIASLAGMVSLGVGLEEQTVGQFMSSGVFDSVTVLPGQSGNPFGGGRGRGRSLNRDRGTAPPETPRKPLDDAAIAEIAAVPDVKEVYPNIAVPIEVQFEQAEVFATLSGVPLSQRDQGAFQKFTAGTFFTDDKTRACILTLEFARRLSIKDAKELIGQDITIAYGASPMTAPDPPAGGMLQPRSVTQRFTIVGIVERPGGALPMGGGGISGVMIPLEQARPIGAEAIVGRQSMLGTGPTPANRAYNSLTIKVSRAAAVPDVQEKVKALGFTTFSLQDALKNAKRLFVILDIVLGLIGSIALAVSSLGIVNTMVMSILERTREIGIMKAIGGSDADVRGIFLVEASAIGLLGGIGGIAIGWAVGRVINFGANMYVRSQQAGGPTDLDLFSLPLWLIGGAIGFSILVSLIAGSYPARRAARLDPIQALRHD